MLDKIRPVLFTWLRLIHGYNRDIRWVRVTIGGSCRITRPEINTPVSDPFVWIEFLESRTHPPPEGWGELVNKTLRVRGCMQLHQILLEYYLRQTHTRGKAQLGLVAVCYYPPVALGNIKRSGIALCREIFNQNSNTDKQRDNYRYRHQQRHIPRHHSLFGWLM